MDNETLLNVIKIIAIIQPFFYIIMFFVIIEIGVDTGKTSKNTKNLDKQLDVIIAQNEQIINHLNRLNLEIEKSKADS